MDKFSQLFQQIQITFNVELSPNQKRAIRAIIEANELEKITDPAQRRLLSELPRNEVFTSERALQIAAKHGVSRASTFRLLSKLERPTYGTYRLII